MAYNNFTLETARKRFQLEETQSIGIFADIEPVTPRAHFITEFADRVSIAAAINTEKAKSELLVAEVLFELRAHCTRQISFFSGIDFNVNADDELTGVCDFLVSLSPNQFDLEAPVIILVEAKRDAPAFGLGQCVAEMIAAQRFNTDKGNDIPRIYGVSTTGTEWLFLKLEERHLQIDRDIYHIKQCDAILGILACMVEQKA